MKNIRVSKLPNITFYTGGDAEICGNALENRNYGFESDYYGTLTMTPNYNSLWDGIQNSTFSENPINYNNIGDILNETISYINKFKNNNVDIQINKNILTFNYKYETDLLNDYENTSIIPSSQILDLLVNINDMTFNKKAYYKNKYELLDVSYARKKYPYRPDGTILNINMDMENPEEFTTYDFSKQFVNYNYIENEYSTTEIKSYMLEYQLDEKEFTSFNKWIKLYSNNESENLINFVSYNDIEAKSRYAIGTMTITDKIIEDKTKIDFNDSSKEDLYNNELYLNSEYNINDDSIYELYKYDYKIVYIPDPNNTYEEVTTNYVNEIYDINKLSDRINLFFENNSNAVQDKYNDLKTYYISELDTMLSLSLNTYSLSTKNLYAYFNFVSEYDNWFDNSITFEMNTENLSNNINLLSIEPLSENWFNVIINDYDKVCGNDIKINNEHIFKIINNNLISEENTKFKIINPSNIKKIDLSENIDKITKLDLINNYKKKINVYNSINTNWINENGQNLESLILGNENKIGNIEKIIGITNFTKLKEIDITNCNKLLKDFSINKLNNLEIFKAIGSNIKNFVPKNGIHLTNVSLPDTLKTLILKNNTIDEFNYTPTANLINVTLQNVNGNGINTQQFIEDWIYQLEITDSPNGDNKLLYDGLITNTTLTGINWNNFDVNKLLKFKYLGLNPDFSRLSGTIGIKGSDIDNKLTRKEYLDLINVFGEEIMETWNYKNITNSKSIKFEYSINKELFNKYVYLYYYNDVEIMWECDTIINDENIKVLHKININDNICGNALLDILDQFENNKSTIEFKLNNEKIGYELKLSKKIAVNSNSSISNLKRGDIILYQGDKLIIVNKSVNNTPYNYIYIGNIEMMNTINSKNIMISFNTFENDDINLIKQFLLTLPIPNN